MTRKTIDLPFVMLILAVLVAYPQAAHAYLDPGTGSYAVQSALGAAFAVLFYARAAWNHLRNLGKIR